jgi:hypothetical protein
MKMGGILARRPIERHATGSTGWPRAMRPSRVLCASLICGVAAAFLGCVTALSACAKHRPARLPLASIYARNTARLEVTTIVVTDEQRADRARHIYTAIAALGERLEKEREHTAAQVVHLTSQPALDLDQVEAAIGRVKRDQKAAFVRYVELQMELRKALTPREFKQLGRFQ